MAEQIPKEERAYFLELADGGELYRQLESGDRVDLVGVFELDKPQEDASEEAAKDSAAREPNEEWRGYMTMVLLQNITVLDVYEHPESGEDGARLALSLTVDELNLVATTSAAGNLTALPRRSGDVEISPVKRYVLAELLEGFEIRAKERQERDPPSEEGRLVERIAEDERALFLDHDLPAGTVRRGDRLDIHGVFDLAEGQLEIGADGGLTTTMLVQNVAVLDVGEEGLIVSAAIEEAQLLMLAEAHGELRFVLRHPEDAETSWRKSTNLGELLNDLEVLCCREKNPPRPCCGPREDGEPQGPIILRGDR